jgi:hypothetical protein
MDADAIAFLSTIAGASAAMVAIIGGLLVARFVSLDSEQQGAQRILADAESRLAIARSRAEAASCDLLHQDARSFLNDWDVLVAICHGMTDLTGLRRRGDPTSLTDEELWPFVEEISEEMARARQMIEDRIPAAEDIQGGDDYTDDELRAIADRASWLRWSRIERRKQRHAGAGQSTPAE